jgi:hypothetical protein
VTISRNAFLKLFGCALVGAGVDTRVVAALESAAAPAVRGASMAVGGLPLNEATAAFFLPHVDTAFRMTAASGDRLRLVLAEITERRVTRHVEQFSLFFHAPRGRVLPDGIHRFEHPSLGAFELFVARVGAGKRRTVYQACFSRLVRA